MSPLSGTERGTGGEDPGVGQGVTIPLAEHPRPDFERAEWQNLNGPWQFQFDGQDVGESRGWPDTGLPAPRPIVVPFPWGSPLSGVPDSAPIAWYARRITLPAAWTGKRVFLVIGAADWRTTAWLDGQQLGLHDGGYVPFTSNPWQWFVHLLMPWTVLAVLFIGFYGRVLRSNILDTINEDYVRTARAKGLPPRRVLVKHVLRNSLIPIVTLFGLDFAAVIGGSAILTETVFGLRGVGQYAADSVQSLDLPPIMGVTIYATFFIVFFSVLVDLLYAWLDPRIRPT